MKVGKVERRWKIPKREALCPVWPGCLWIQQYLINAVIVSFVFFLYLRIWHMGMSFFISLNKPLLKYTPHVGSFWQFVICCIYVIVYFTFVFLYLCVWPMGISILIYPWTTLFSKIYHILGLSGTSSYAVIVYFEFVFLYLCV